MPGTIQTQEKKTCINPNFKNLYYTLFKTNTCSNMNKKINYRSYNQVKSHQIKFGRS